MQNLVSFFVIMFELPKHIAVEITIVNNYNKPMAFIIFHKRQLKSNQRKNLKIDKRTWKIAPFWAQKLTSY